MGIVLLAAVWCSDADAHIKLLYRVASGASYLTGDVLSLSAFCTMHFQRQPVTVLCMHAVLDQVKPDSPSLVLYLCRICQCGLHVMLWSHIGKLMCLLAAEPHDIYSPLSVCGTILLTLYVMVWDWRVLRGGPMLFYWPRLLAPFLFSPVFPSSSSFLWVGIVGLRSSVMEGG